MFSWKVEESHNEQIRYAKYQIMIKFEGKTQSCKSIDRGKRAATAGWPGNGWPLLSTGMKEGEQDHLEEFPGRGSSTCWSPEGRESWGVEGARSLLKPRAERGQDWVIRVGWMPGTGVLHAALTCSTEPVSSRQEFWEPVVKQRHY